MMATADKGRKVVEKKAQQLERLVVEYVPVESIKPNAYNPNRQSEHDFELLKRSMGEDGFTQPIICQKATREIVDGEHRWRCAQALGYKEIPVVFVDMTIEQMRIATLRHNRARGTEDIELSAQVLKDLQALGAIEWAADSLMIDDTELNKLLNDTDVSEALAAQEHSESWEPVKLVEGSSEKFDGGEAMVSGSASEALRKKEAELKSAKTEQERAKIRKEADVFRLVFVFTGEEAVIVKKVLGTESPPTKLVEICKKLLDG